jgi:hypothetical protein
MLRVLISGEETETDRERGEEKEREKERGRVRERERGEEREGSRRVVSTCRNKE